MSIIRAEVVESAANTLTELAFTLPTDPGSRLGIEVHTIRCAISALTPSALPSADAILNHSVSFALSVRQSLTALPELSTPGTLYHREPFVLAASAPADAGVAFTSGELSMPAESHFTVPLVLATTQLSGYIQGNAQSAARSAFVMISYKFITLTAEQLVTALSLTETL